MAANGPVAVSHTSGLIADSLLTPSKVLIPNCLSLLMGRRELDESFFPVLWVYFRPLKRYINWLSNTAKNSCKHTVLRR